MRRNLLVGGAGQMDHQSLGIADIGEMAGEFHVLDEPDTGLVPTLQPEGEYRPRTLRHVLPRQLVSGM